MNYHIFDDLNEYVYIADVETYEMVYANRKVLKNFGYTDFSEIQGSKCYTLLHRLDKPCSFCNNCKLNEHEVYEWTAENALVDKIFDIKDNLIIDAGRKLRIEIAKSNSELLDEKKEMELREQFIDRAFGIASKATDIEQSIDIFLEMIGKYIQAERAYIFESFEPYISNTYEWCKEGVSREKHNLQKVDRQAMKPWFDLFDTEGEVYIEDLESTKDIHPEIYKYLKPQNISNLMVRPIKVNGTGVGFYGVDNMDMSLLHEVRSVLGMVSTLISIMIEKRNYIRYIQHSGTYDYLTNILNRNSASKKIDAILKETRGTLILIDLDNFKSVNDVFGHNMGDEVLKTAARKMMELARETDIVFRLGGDEFGMFFPSLIKEEIIKKKCDLLLDKLNIDVLKEGKQVHVSASLGACISDNTECTFSQLYHKADEVLYQSKNSGKNKYNLSYL